MKKIQFALVCVVLLVMGGCAQMMVKNVSLTNHFDAEESRSALEPGNNTIKGSAVIRRNDGVVVTCAGMPVQIIPVTAYSSEIMAHAFGNTYRGYAPANAFAGKGVNFTNIDPAYNASGKRKSTGDAQGFFIFDNLKDGEYFVMAAVTWQASQYVQEGGALMQRVKVSNGQTVEVVLSPHS